MTRLFLAGSDDLTLRACGGNIVGQNHVRGEGLVLTQLIVGIAVQQVTGIVVLDFFIYREQTMVGNVLVAVASKCHNILSLSVKQFSSA